MNSDQRLIIEVSKYPPLYIPPVDGKHPDWLKVCETLGDEIEPLKKRWSELRHNFQKMVSNARKTRDDNETETLIMNSTTYASMIFLWRDVYSKEPAPEVACVGCKQLNDALLQLRQDRNNDVTAIEQLKSYFEREITKFRVNVNREMNKFRENVNRDVDEFRENVNRDVDELRTANTTFRHKIRADIGRIDKAVLDVTLDNSRIDNEITELKNDIRERNIRGLVMNVDTS